MHQFTRLFIISDAAGTPPAVFTCICRSRHESNFE